MLEGTQEQINNILKFYAPGIFLNYYFLKKKIMSSN